MAAISNYRRAAAPPYRDHYVVPRLELDVIATPRHQRDDDVTYRPPARHSHRRAHTEHDAYRRPRMAAVRDRADVTVRAVTEGSYLPAQRYRRRERRVEAENEVYMYRRREPPVEAENEVYRYRRREPPVEAEGEAYRYRVLRTAGPRGDDTARVSLYTHDSHDPYSCMCYPQSSSRTIPTMMYDEVRCPHPEHVYQPAKQDYFAYPWTVQTNRPRTNRLPPLPFGYREGQQKPPSAVTAPPFTMYRSKEVESLRQRAKAAGTQEKPLPQSAPMETNYAPLLSAEPSDRRLRRTNRRKLASLPALPTLEEDVSPFDSVSQVVPPRAFRRDSLRLGTVDDPTARTARAGLRGQNNAAPATQDFPQTPTRIFKGEYLDPTTGRSYQYDIKYGRTILGGTKRLKTV